MSVSLNPEKALVFRIVHAANVPWILAYGGLYARNSPQQDPNYVNIGSVELIDKRARRVVPVPPGGTLSDYVPFYFTPFSMMMYNIKTGYGGVTQRRNADIVIFVSSIHRLQELGLPYLFTNQHAYAAATDYFSRPERLDRIDWELLRSKNFKTDAEDPGKQLRYQAEALVHQRVPLEAILGIGCHDEAVRKMLDGQLAVHGIKMSVRSRPEWYF